MTRALSPREKTTAVIELTGAAAFWGFGFIAAVWALEAFGPLGVTAWRLGIAALAGVAVVALIPNFRRQFNVQEFRLAFWPGLFLSATLLLQVWGLKYTTATKSGFITILYVLIVPILEGVLMKRKLPKFHFWYVALALVGVAFVCELPQTLMSGAREGISDRERWNFGDWLTLACAVAASLQILWFGLIQNRITSAFNFNIYQTFWAALLPIPLALWLEPFPAFPQGQALFGMAMLIFGSTLLAFFLQVRAQKKISPSLASLLFLLESPFAAIFAYILLSERLTTYSALGAALILVALGSSVVYSRESGRETGREPETQS